MSQMEREGQPDDYQRETGEQINILDEVNRRVGGVASANVREVREILARSRVAQQGPLAIIVVVVYVVTGAGFMLVACVLTLRTASTKEGLDSLLILMPVAAGYWGPAIGFVLGFYFQRSE